MRKALAAVALGATLSVAPAADVVLAQDADTEEDDDSGNWGLLGLIGLLGLAGLAGLKRRKDTGYTAGYTATPGDAVAPNIHGATGRSVDS
jgi:MYXO-CTERM domain-containing protein